MRMNVMKHNFLTGFGGNTIHYQATGNGPALVCCNGVGVSTIFWKYIHQYFCEDHTIVTWDYRGHGLSGPAANFEGWSIQNVVEDLLEVMDDAEIEKAVLLGHSMGVQVILEAQRMAPDRVSGLIPVCGTYGDPIKTFLNFPFSYQLFKVTHYLGMNKTKIMQSIVRRLVDQSFTFNVARLFLIDPQLASREDFVPYFEHIKNLDVRVFFTMAAAAVAHSAEDHLPYIDCPVLVIGGENDIFTPFELCERMARMIPKAELLRIRKGSHASIIEQPELINLRIEKFFRERIPKWE